MSPIQVPVGAAQGGLGTDNKDIAVWHQTRQSYNWTARLSDFLAGSRYPGFFARTILPHDVTGLEDYFRVTVGCRGAYPVVGEVCFWKNYGSATSRDRITLKLLEHLGHCDNWLRFCTCLESLRHRASFAAFVEFIGACSQPSGFATPITFLSFLDPLAYPMVDRHIGAWWNNWKASFGYDQAPFFIAREDGWLGPLKQNWHAYLAWTEFARQWAHRLGWRARDVEMAVWEAQKRSIQLSTEGVIPTERSRLG